MREDIENPIYPGKPFISAEEVMMEIQRLNHKNIPKLPEYLKTLPPIKIYNLSDIRHERGMGGLGTFTIQPCEKDQRFSRPLEICPIFPEAIVVDKDHMEYRFHDGMDIALTIVGAAKHIHPGESLIKWGCFIAAGQEPTEPEITVAKRALFKTYETFALEAMGFLQQPGEERPDGTVVFFERRNVTPLHIKAIKIICGHKP